MISLVDVMNIFDLWEGKTQFSAETGKLEIFGEDKTLEMTLGTTVASNGEEVGLLVPPMRINTLMYVPLRFTCEELGAKVSASYDNDMLVVNVVTMDDEFEVLSNFVNSQNISSRTEYLIWVDKSDYRVTLFEGSKNNWRGVGSYPCSIGAPSSPTITGQFEYFSKETRWSYPTYYVGPIMRFYRGYALHSTLLRYNGADADARLGQKISHGCVRMVPEDIQYLWDTVPLYTKVYVTE